MPFHPKPPRREQSTNDMIKLMQALHLAHGGDPKDMPTLIEEDEN